MSEPAGRGQTIRWRLEDGVCRLELYRPEIHNALDRTMKDEILALLDDLRGRPEARALLVTGGTESVFCAGADVHEFHGRTPLDRWRYDHNGLRNLFDAIERHPLPVVAMINGLCVGGGTEIALACDIRVAATSARIGLTELRFGMIPGAGGTQRLARLVGEGHAAELVLSGDPVDATRAERIGLVNRAWPAQELESRTREMLGRIVRHSPVALELGKAALRSAARMPLEAGLAYEVALSTLVFSAPDKDEAISAFLDRRSPRQQGA